MGLKRARKYNSLKAEELTLNFDMQQLDAGFEAEHIPDEGIIGQEKAIKALQVGIEIKSPGYNIFVTGLSGTGKLSTIKKVLESITPLESDLSDYAYVNNFNDEDRPILLEFPKGKGAAFKKTMELAIKFMRENIPQFLENQQYLNKKKRLVDSYGNTQQKLYMQFEDKLQNDGFTLGQSQSTETPQPEILIERDKKLYYIQQLDELLSEKLIDKKEAIKLSKKYSSYKQELQIVLRKGIKLSQEFQTKLTDLEKEHTSTIVMAVLDEVKSNFQYPKVSEYLNMVAEDVLNNLDVFAERKDAKETPAPGIVVDYLKAYEVNVILDNSETKGAPVIIETYPTYNNIFGTIDKMSDGNGGWYSDFSKIKTGSLLRANNGYLILRAIDSFNEPGVWKTLKRVLLYGNLEIQDPGTYYQIATSMLKPEPIKINTKIIFIGNNEVYNMLSNYEDDFNKIFKIKAEFDYEMNRTDRTIIEFYHFIKYICKKESLLDFDLSAIEKIFQYSARYAGNKNKLTTRFAYIIDLMLESNFWAKNDGASEVSAKHIQEAYETTNDRHGLGNYKMTEMMKKGIVLIDTIGKRVGQINGLAVYGDGITSYGKPTRITASVSIGSGNIINVERESGLSGSSHNKGVLIISGFIREMFGKTIPLSFNASLVFEQGYGMIDGDSASIAEIAALLSCLSEIPINQQIAVTGSVNQKGDAQPIGGVNEKIEGFFDICKTMGLTGKQGVIIPTQNVDDLLLKDEVVEAVKSKRFYIYAVSNVSEALELLFGYKAGERLKSGSYEKETIFGKVEENLCKMHKVLRPKPASTKPNKDKKEINK